MKKEKAIVLSTILGTIGGTIVSSCISNKTIKQKEKKVDKFKSYYRMLNQWLILKQEGKSLENYFVNNNYNTIAIYGLGELGKRLYEELKDSSIVIQYAIDKEAEHLYSELEVKNQTDRLPKVDAIIITPIFEFDNIAENLSIEFSGAVVSLEDVIYEL